MNKENEINPGQTVEIRSEEEIFQPFKNLPEFTKLNLNELESKDSMILWTAKFIFNDTLVMIDVLTEEDPEGIQNTATPLGEARKVISFNNGKMQIDELPLSLGIDLNFKSIEDFRKSRGHALKFNLGKENYYLNLSGEEDPEAIEKTILSGNDNESFDYSPKDERGNQSTVLLPFRSDLLRNITAQIVKKDLPR